MIRLSFLLCFVALAAGCPDPETEPLESAPVVEPTVGEDPGLVAQARGAGHQLLVRRLGAVETLHPASAHGHWALEIQDGQGRTVWTAVATEAGPTATVDWSGLDEGRVVVVLKTLDAGTLDAVPWLEQSVHLVEGEAPRVEGRLLIEPESASTARVVELVEQARSGAVQAGSKDERISRAGDRQLISALLHLRDLGLVDPEAARAAFAEMHWADGADAELIDACVREVELAQELGVVEASPR